jgi:hypothetical protein
MRAAPRALHAAARRLAPAGHAARSALHGQRDPGDGALWCSFVLTVTCVPSIVIWPATWQPPITKTRLNMQADSRTPPAPQSAGPSCFVLQRRRKACRGLTCEPQSAQSAQSPRPRPLAAAGRPLRSAERAPPAAPSRACPPRASRRRRGWRWSCRRGARRAPAAAAAGVAGACQA